MLNIIYATKQSMTQTFNEGKRVPLTVLTVDTHVALGSKTVERDGYASQVIGIGEKKSVSKPVSTFLKKLGIEKAPRVIKEVKSIETIEPNTTLNLAEILVPGATVSVASTSKGKGIAGVMKRWGFHGGPRTHGQSDRGRAPGSIARGTTPGRVVKGKHMAGRMGGDMISVRNLKINSFDPETGKLTVTGTIPGARGTLARITVTKVAKLI